MGTRAVLAGWGRARWALVALSAAAGASVAAARSGGGASWEALLVAHDLREVKRLVWLEEPRPGQWALALAEAVPGEVDGEGSQGRRDVIAFEGLASGGGAPHRVRAVGNLTRTPDADEVVLDVSQARALVASQVGREVTSVAVVDLSGDPEVFLDDEGRPRPAGERVKLAAVHWQELGRPGGVGQRVYVLEPPVGAIKGRMEGDYAALESGEGATARVRLSDGAVEGALGLQAQPREVTVESWVQFAVNRARAVPWIGASRIALLEKYVFDRVDRGRQLWYGVVGVDREELAAQMVEGGQAHAAPPPQAPEVIEAQEEAIALGPAADWPLPDLKAPAASWPGGALEGEGQWRRWEPAWIDKLGRKGRPWPVLRTSVRVDRSKEYAFVTLVAMDMRQLDLHLLAGTSNPRSTTGLRGTGEIPRDAETMRNLLIAFNGGFKTSHGAFGMVLDRKVFVPPKAAMATLGLMEDGTIRMGTWPGEAPTGHYRQEQQWQVEVASQDTPIPKEVVSLRQNLPPLVGEGKLNPLGARRWGGPVAHLSHTSTPRSAVCARPPGALLFVWCDSCGAGELGEAMLLAGCEHGMHLDMNPLHSGLAMFHVPVGEDGALPPPHKETGFAGAQAEIPVKKMHFDTFRYLGRDVKDFFYVTFRPSLVDRLRGPLPWSTRGLPTHSNGLEPLAVSGRGARGEAVLALQAGDFSVARAEPKEASPGSLRLRWFGALDGGGEQGAALVVSGAGALEVTTAPAPGAAVLARGAALVSGGRAAPGAREAKDGLVVAQTRGGDVLVGWCEGCAVDALLEAMAPAGLEAAVWLGRGSLEVSSQAPGQPWAVVQRGAGGAEAALELWLVPRAESPRVGISSFEAR